MARLQHAALLSLLAALLISAGPKPMALVESPVILTVYDGITNDLLTAGLGAAGLAKDKFPITIPSNRPPTADELRKLAIYHNYRALVDVSEAGGYGKWYGPTVQSNGMPRSGDGMIAGDEYLAFDKSNAAAHVTLMVQIPITFDPQNACLVTAPSSGSRGIYGDIAVAGEWGLKHGCAVAYTDKGTGIGAHDLQNNLVNGLQGQQIDASQAKQNPIFASELSGSRLSDFNDRHRYRFAFKHAHSLQNPEKDWGQNVLNSIRFAFEILGEKYQGAVTKRNTIVIAASVSNGGGSSLRAAEQDAEGLIDGVAVGEPNVNPVYSDAFVIQMGETVPVSHHSRRLVDYITLMNVYQGCANAAVENAAAPFNSFNQFSQNRCKGLHEKGLLKSANLREQAAEAQAIINDYGILPEQNLVQPGYWLFSFPQAISVTFANAYSRSSVSDNLCDFSFAAVGGPEKRPVPVAPEAGAQLFGTSSGVPPDGVIALINNAADGGPAENETSAANGIQDQNLNGALCLRRIATGTDPLSGQVLSSRDPFGEVAARVSQGVTEIMASGRLHGIPAIIVTGRNDGILAPNFTSRAYYGLNKTLEGESSNLFYYEITNAHHLDTLNNPAWGSQGYAERYIPLHRYYVQALDLMYSHLKYKTPLPPSQVVHTKPRGSGAPPITDVNVPPIAGSPTEEYRITFTPGKVFIPN